MKKVAYVGCGSLALQIRQFLREAHGRAPIDECGFDQKDSAAMPFPVMPMSRLLDAQFQDREFYICLGYHHLPKKLALLEELVAAGRRLPPWVHASAYVSPTAKLGDGCLVFPGCNLDQNSAVGAGVLLHNSVVVSHDSSVGAGSYLSPGVVLCGNVVLGEKTFLGAGTVVSNGLRIGKDAFIGIGSVVTSNVPDGASAIGNPLRMLQEPLKVI